MDNEIRILADKMLKVYPKITNNIDKNELVNLVISKKHHYNSTKGNFNGYFGTLIKSYMVQL